MSFDARSGHLFKYTSACSEMSISVRPQRRPFRYAVLFASLVIYFVIAGTLSQRLPSWSEEPSLFPGLPARVLARAEQPESGPELEVGCEHASAPKIVRSISRPFVSLCAAGRAWPLSITSYISGPPYWTMELFAPWHKGSVLRMRWISVAIGGLSLALAYAVTRRFAGQVAANVVAMTSAVSSPYLHMHGLGVMHELMAWPCILGAILLAWKRGFEEPNWRRDRFRYFGAGLLLGFAVAANLKTLFVATPLIAFAYGAGWLPALRFTIVAPLGAGALLGTLPFALTLALDSGQGVSREIARRLLNILSQLRPERIVEEAISVSRFAADFPVILELASGDRPRPHLVAYSLFAGAICFALFETGRLLLRRTAPSVASLGGALLAPHILVGALLYTHYPNAGYAAVHGVFGFVSAGAVLAIAAKFARTPKAHSRLAHTVGFLTACLLLSATALRGDPSRYLTFPLDPGAQRSAALDLAQLAGEKPVLTTTYNLGGMMESLSDRRVRTTQVQHFLECEAALMPACVEERWSRILADTQGPFFVVGPIHDVPIEGKLGPVIIPTLERAARNSGAALHRVRDYPTASGTPVLTLIEVTPREG